MKMTKTGMCVILAGVAGLAFPIGPAPAGARAWAAAATDNVPVIGSVNPTHLYLRTGEVDASVGRAGLENVIPTAAGRHFVIQLGGPMTPAWRSRLTGAGMAVGDYLPMNAFIVTMDKADAKAVAGLEFIRWWDEYRAEWRVDAQIGKGAYVTPERQALARAGKAVVAVTLFHGEPADATGMAIGKWQGATVHWVEDEGGCQVIAATIRMADVGRMSGLSGLQFAEDAPEITVRNDTDRWIVQSNVPNVTPFYDNGIHGEGQVVGLLDQQMDRNHCSFFDTNPIGPLHRKILAYNTAFGAMLHGTHVAGTAVGDAGDNTATRGVAYGAKIVYNVIPSFTESSVLNALTLHHNQGGRMHTNSWGNDGTTAYDALCRGFDVFGYNFEDSFVCLAVTNLSTLRNPENAKNLLAVGASQDTPNQATFCSGGTGPTSDGRRKPEIFAPGCGTNSALAGTACSLTALTGTSMASPAVAGAGALVRQYYTGGYYPTGAPAPADAFTPTGALIKATLLNSAVDMTGIAGYPSNQEGWGRVLAHNAAHFAADARRVIVRDERNSVGRQTNDVEMLLVMVNSSSLRFNVTLVWTDPPAAVNAAFAPINDLDLEAVSPGGLTYLGNVFGGGQSVTGGTRDIRNNVEQVQLAAPEPGRWTVRVRATAVNQAMQGYALVISGDVAAVGPCPCDWNHVNGLDSQDFFDFLSDFFAGSADFNHSGSTDSQDFFDFLTCFFAGCS